MKLLERILFATDFSKASQSALEGVLPLVQAFESDIILMHAIEHLPNVPQAYSRVNRMLQKKLRELQNRIRSYGVKCTHEPILQIGNVSQVVRDVADRYDVNLIVLGASHKDMGDRLFIGSSAEKIIRTASQPVWTEVPGQHEGTISKILCAVDYSESSSYALNNAIFIARQVGAHIIALHVVPEEAHYPFIPELSFPVMDVGMLDYSERSLPPYIHQELQESGLPVPEDSTMRDHKRALEKYLQEFDFKDVSFEARIEIGKPADVILRTARQEKTQLLVMGSAGRTGLLRWVMGNTAERIVRKAPCSLLTVKSQDILHVKLDPTLTTGQRFRQARRLLESGLLQQAIEELQGCINADKNFAEAYEALAEAYTRMGDNEQADTMRTRSNAARQWTWEHQIQISPH